MAMRFEKVFLSGAIFNLPTPKEIINTGRFLVPFLEEIFFRGFMLASFYKVTRNFGVTAVVTSVLFSAAHYNFMAPTLSILLISFLLGLITSFIMFRYWNLWYCIAFHFTYNLIVWITH